MEKKDRKNFKANLEILDWELMPILNLRKEERKNMGRVHY